MLAVDGSLAFSKGGKEAFGVTGHEPYLIAEWFKNTAVGEGNVRATKSAERKQRYIATR